MTIRGYEVPDVLGKIEELCVIWTVSLLQVEALRARIAAAQKELDIETASEAGIARMEQMFNLDPAGYTMEDRRFRLQCWMEDIGIYSDENIEDWIIKFGGEGTEVIHSQQTQGACTVLIPLSSENKVKDLQEKLNKIIPLGTEMTVSAIYQKFKNFENQTWNDLSEKTFGEVKRGE